MSRKIRLKRGALKDLPQLELGEPGVATDEGTMFIGTDRGNIRLANQEDLAEVSQQLADIATVIVTNHGIISDGVTDQTQALIDLFTGELKDFSGNILIPYNVKFNINQVYSNVPLNAYVEDKSMINFYKTSTYWRKVLAVGGADSSDRDFTFMVISGHNANLIINNLGTSESESGSRKASTMSHAHGVDASGNPIVSFRNQASLENGKYLRRVVIVRKADGTTLQSSLFVMDENGFVSINGDPETNIQLAINEGHNKETTTTAKIQNRQANSMSQLVMANKKNDGTDASFRIRNDNSDKTLFLKNNTTIVQEVESSGVRNKRSELLNWANLPDGSTSPNVENGTYFVVNNSAPTSITNFTTSLMQKITIVFTNGNTTLVNGSIRLNKNTNWTPAAKASITLVKTSFSNDWIEVSRSE